MKTNRAMPYVVGFLCGVGALALGMALTHTGWPRPAAAAPVAPAATASPAPAVPTAEEFADAVIREIKNLTQSGTDSKANALKSDVQTMRSQIELYKVQHGGKTPGIDADGRFDGRLFATQLTSRTDDRGNVFSGQGKRDDYPYGPYLVRMPANPFLREPRASQVSAWSGAGSRVPSGDANAGWWYDSATGEFSPYEP